MSNTPVPASLLQHCASWAYPMTETDPARAMAYLAKNLASEGHTGAFGRTVDELARLFLGPWHYDYTGEECRGVVRLLQLGCGNMVVTLPA